MLWIMNEIKFSVRVITNKQKWNDSNYFKLLILQLLQIKFNLCNIHRKAKRLYKDEKQKQK